MAALAYGEEGYSVLNIGTGKGYSVLEVIRTFEDFNKIKVPWDMAPWSDGDLPEIYGDVTKAADKLNWKAEFDLKDMMRDTWNWQKSL